MKRTYLVFFLVLLLLALSVKFSSFVLDANDIDETIIFDGEVLGVLSNVSYNHFTTNITNGNPGVTSAEAVDLYY